MSTSKRGGKQPSAKEQRQRLARLNEAAAWLLRESQRLLKKHGKRLDEDLIARIEQLRGDLTIACEPPPKDRDADRVDAAAARLDEALDKHLARFRKSPMREYVEAIGWAIVLALLIRSFVFEAFKIPTGSMIPTLHVHDHLFVNKFIYGIKIPFTRIKFLQLRTPHRGEVVVFEYPYADDADSTGKDLIKRVIATAGDTVQLRDNHLEINGKPIARKLLTAQGDCGEAVGAIARCAGDGDKWCLNVGGGEGGSEQELAMQFATPAAAAEFVQEREGFHCKQSRECMSDIAWTSQHRVPAHDTDLVMWLGPLNDPTWPPAELDPQRFGPHASVYSKAENPTWPRFTVPEGHVFVMGDNRDNSKDGRYFGLVPLSVIKGKAGFIWYAYKRDFWRPDFDRIGTYVHPTEQPHDCAD